MKITNFRFVGVNYLKPDGFIWVYWTYEAQNWEFKIYMRDLLQFYQDNPSVWFETENIPVGSGEMLDEPVSHSFDFIITSYNHFETFLKAFIIKNYYE